MDRRGQPGTPPARGSARQDTATRITAEDIQALVASLHDITATLAAADPAAARVYAEMEIDITYHEDGRVVVESWPLVVESGVGEALPSRTTRVAMPATSFLVG